MTLETIYYVSQIVAVAAILGSLIFVGLQVRQGTEQTRQANRLARAEMSLASWTAGIGVQESAFATQEGSDFMERATSGADLTPGERLRFSVYMSDLLSSVEVVDVLWRDGLIDPSIYDRSKRGVALYFQSPRGRRWWSRAREDRFVSPFREVIDEIVRRADTAGASSTAAAGRVGP